MKGDRKGLLKRNNGQHGKLILLAYYELSAMDKKK